MWGYDNYEASYGRKGGSVKTTAHIRRTLVASVNDVPNHAITFMARDLNEALRLLRKVQGAPWRYGLGEHASEIDRFLREPKKGGA